MGDVCESREEHVEAVTRWLGEREKAALETRGQDGFHVAVSGGSQPNLLAAILETNAQLETPLLTPSKWHVYLVDERVVRMDSEHSTSGVLCGQNGMIPTSLPRTVTFSTQTLWPMPSTRTLIPKSSRAWPTRMLPPSLPPSQTQTETDSRSWTPSSWEWGPMGTPRPSFQARICWTPRPIPITSSSTSTPRPNRLPSASPSRSPSSTLPQASPLSPQAPPRPKLWSLSSHPPQTQSPASLFPLLASPATISPGLSINPPWALPQPQSK